MKFSVGFGFFLLLISHQLIGQSFTEILGRPANNAVTMSILFDQKSEVYWEYGTSAGSYPLQTQTFTTVADTALEADFINLVPDTKYYYRTRYRPEGTSGTFLALSLIHISEPTRPY